MLNMQPHVGLSVFNLDLCLPVFYFKKPRQHMLMKAKRDSSLKKSKLYDLWISHQSPVCLELGATKAMSERPPSSSPQGPTNPSTTFVRADATTFKEVVQRLTGPHDEPPHHPPTPPRPPDSATAQGSSSSKATGIKRPTFKLHERRHGSRSSKLTIVKPNTEAGFSASPVTRSPSPSPSSRGYVLSPSSELLNLDLNEEEEEKAIKERRFYLHPSPRSGSRSVEPELLPLFPLDSPMKNPTLPPLPPL